MKRFLRILFRILKNKYVLSALVFLVWILFFDRHNLLDRHKYNRELRQLESEKQFYLEKIETDSKKLNQLKTDDANLEKFAREQYFMKKPDEDIYLIVPEE